MLPGEAIQPCSSCRYRKPTGDGRTGSCRIEPPKVFVLPGQGGQPVQLGVWPPVDNAHGGCASGRPLEGPSTPLRVVEGAGAPPMEYAGGPLVIGNDS